jgi:hypothetical protein
MNRTNDELEKLNQELLAEQLRRRYERANEHNMIYYDNKYKNNHIMNHNMLSAKEYAKIMFHLDKWNVYAGKKIIKQFVDNGKAETIREAFNRTIYGIRNKHVPNPGAYFRSVLNNL